MTKLINAAINVFEGRQFPPSGDERWRAFFDPRDGQTTFQIEAIRLVRQNGAYTLSVDNIVVARGRELLGAYFEAIEAFIEAKKRAELERERQNALDRGAAIAKKRPL